MKWRTYAYIYGLLVWIGLFLLLHWLLPALSIPAWAGIRPSWKVFIELNAATFLLFAFDKISAQLRRQRIPEYMLYLATFLGGSIGALAAMNFLRHKTKKTSFQIVIALLILVQIYIAFFLS